jgi:tetratricopeptide (TPR) repeat protein
MSLTPAQYRQIIDLCAPHMQTSFTRQSRFDTAFTQHAAFRNDINWEGATNTFLTHFVNLLLKVHRHNGAHPLRTLLETLKAEYGEDAQRQIDALLPLIDALPPDACLPELPFTIFLSYARDDDRAFVRLLYKELTQHGLNVWLDEKNMPNRGLGFEQEIAYAIEQADYLLLICGPAAYQSEYVRKEWQHALLHCKPIVPIVRLGEFPPPILGAIGAKPVDAIDMRDDDKFESELKHVVRQLKEQPRPLGALTRVPQPKRWYIERPALRNKIASALLSHDRDNIFAISAIRGLPGVGKSAMAAIVAHDCQVRRTFSDGIILIEAGVKAKPFELQTRLGMFLGIEAKEFKEDIEFNKALLIARLRDKRMLLILDNVWRKDQVDALQCGVSTLRILFTTRRVELAEQLAEQNNVNISLLEPDEGADLIQRRAGLADDQRDVCRAISRQLNGLTLAVSIAAAKIRVSGMQPSEYLASLKDDPNPLSQLTLVRNEFDDPNDPEQHFAASLNLSYRDLDAQDQSRFRALSVFAPDGTFDAEAAAAVWAVPLEAAQATLNALVDLELVQVEDGRYSQHSLLRAYARALSAADELQAAAARHSNYYLTRHNYGDDMDFLPHAAKIALDFENIRAALMHGFDHQPERACLFAVALNGGFMQLHQPFAVRRQLLEQGLAAAERAGYARGQAHTLRALGELEVMEANYPRARECYSAALRLFEAIPDQLGQAYTLRALGELEVTEANYPRARECYSAALRLFEAIPDQLGQAHTLRALGELEVMEANYPRARECHSAALRLFEAIPDPLGQAYTLQALGELEVREANYPRARECYSAALRLYEAIPDKLGQAQALCALGDLEVMEANYPRARECYSAALGLFEAIPSKLGQAQALYALGELEVKEASYPRARECYSAALRLYEAIPNQLGQANTLKALGDLELGEANYPRARECYSAALRLYEAIPNQLGQANTLKALGDLELGEANYPRARECYSAALRLYEAIPDKLGQANTLQALGDLERMEANYRQARSNYLQALELARAIPDLVCQLNSLIGLARLEATLNNRDAACQRYAELFALTDSTPAFANHPITQNLRREAAQVCGGEAGRSSAAEGIYGVQQREPNQAEMAQLLQQLFESFMNISNSAEMEQFVAQTPAQQLDMLERTLETAILQLSPSVQAVLRQRLEDLRRLRRGS